MKADSNERDKMAFPLEFGGSWEVFCREWRATGGLAYTPSEASHGLSTLIRLWPEEVARIVGGSERGSSKAATSIALGLILEQCEPVANFSHVLKRLKGGQRSAYSELVVGTALLNLKYDPEFEPPKGGPDARCVVDGVTTLFEVYAPQRSVVANELQELVRELQSAISGAVTKCRVEVELIDLFDENDISAAVEVVGSTAPSAWAQVAGWARVRRIDEGQDLVSCFDGSGSQVAFGEDVATQRLSTGVIVRWEEADGRAERQLEAKRAQIKKRTHAGERVANVVVFSVAAVGGTTTWPEAIAELYGDDFDNIGAVAFFDQGVVGPPEAVRRDWRIVTNPRRLVAIPKALLAGIESLDESSYSNLPRKTRLVMKCR
jgi:hypothetical protein